MAKIEIRNLRISFIWVDTFFDILAVPPPTGAQLKFLGSPAAYAAQFNAIGSPGGDESLSRPWPRPEGQLFWTYYLEGSKPGDVTGDQAWKSQVPFRVNVGGRLSQSTVNGRFGVEGYFFPHGTAVVITAHLLQPATLNASVDLAFAIRRDLGFDLTWDSGTHQTLKLPQAAEAVLDVLGTRALGAKVTPVIRSAQPFSVATVIQASGVKGTASTTDGSPTHRALDALTSWTPGWKKSKLPALATTAITTRSGPAAADVLYARSRGRAVWFARLLDPTSSQTSALACYHRNLTLASLQVEALGGLMRGTAPRLAGPVPLSTNHLECARRAAGIMGRLYGANENVYRSWSPRTQMDQNTLVAPTNTVRAAFGMPTLS